MAFIKEILPYINEKFPGLVKSKFYFDSKKVDFKDRDKLLPFLILQNTMDDKKRAIITFLDTHSDHYKLIPVFVSIGLAMRTKIKTISPSKDWQSVQFIYDGSYVKFSYLDVQSDRVYLSTGTGFKNPPPKLNDFKYAAKTYNSTGAKTVFELINYIGQQKLSKEDTLSMHLSKLNIGENELDGGVLLVTRKTKFREIVKSFKIDDKKIIDLINIEETKWNKDNADFDYVSISKSNSKQSKPLVLVTGYDEFGSISTFIKEYPHITSVVFDDAGENIKKFNSSSFERFKKDFIALTQFRDLYFVLDETDLEHKSFFENLVSEIIPVHNWMSSSADINEDYVPNKIDITLCRDRDQTPYSISKECFKELYRHNYFDIIFPIFNQFRDFVKRWNSFYDPEYMLAHRNSIMKDLNDLYENNISRLKYVEEILQRIKDQLNHFVLDNQKFKRFETLVERYKIIYVSKIYLLSENQNQVDQEFILKNIDPLLKNKILFIENSFGEFDSNSVVFSFGSNKRFTSMLLYRQVESEIHFILDCKDLEFFRFTYFKTRKLLNDILDIGLRNTLLNVSDNLNFQNDLLPYTDISKSLFDFQKLCDQSGDVVKNTHSEDADIVLENLDLFKFLEGEDRPTAQGYYSPPLQSKDHEHSVLIFDDGSSIIYPNSKYVYAVDSFDDDDDDEFNSLSEATSKLKRKISDLHEGYFLFVFSTEKTSDLHEFVEDQINSHSELKVSNDLAEAWRRALLSIYEKLGEDSFAYTTLLGKYIERSPQTFKNWLNGFTMVPDTDYRDKQDVLKTIADIVRNDQRFKDVEFNYNDDLRSKMKKMKRFKIGLPKLLIKKAFYKRINLNISTGDIELEHFVDLLSENIEVKNIKHIYKL
jgi:hypothetical protein